MAGLLGFARAGKTQGSERPVKENEITPKQKLVFKREVMLS